MRLIFALLAIAFLCAPANAQSLNKLCFPTNASGTNCQNVTSSNPLPVDATVSASVSGFAPSLAYGTCTATGSSCASTAIPTNTGSVILFNAGTATVSCTLASGAATATTNELQIPASSGLPIATTYASTTYDHFACIDQTGSTSNVVIASGGSGLPTGWGGGGGGGSGGAVTIADGADVALGTTTDTAWSSGAGTVVGVLKGIYGAAVTGTATNGSAYPGSSIGIGTKDSSGNIQPISAAVPVPIALSGLCSGCTASQGSATGTTAATSTTLAAVASVTEYVCGFSIRANATAAATGNATLSDGTITLNFTQWTAPNASGVGVSEQIFLPCRPASAVNTAWTLTSAAPGTGGVVSVTMWGYTK